MPNHVKNILSAVGSPEDVAAFVRAARGRMPPNGDPPSPRSFTYGVPPESSFCFHALVPLPESYSRVPYGDGSPGCGHEMEVKTWGVKWGAYSVAGPVVEGTRHAHATWSFQTAWSHCETLLQKASPKFPGLHFLLAFGGEVDDPGLFVVKDGERSRLISAAEDSPKSGDYQNEDAHWEAHLAWRDSLIFSHPERLAHALAAKAGLEGVEDGPLSDWLLDEGHERLAGWIGDPDWMKTLKPEVKSPD